jgi:hypothetical protein
VINEFKIIIYCYYVVVIICWPYNIDDIYYKYKGHVVKEKIYLTCLWETCVILVVILFKKMFDDFAANKYFQNIGKLMLNTKCLF